MKCSPFSSLFERWLNALPIMQMWMFIVNPDIAGMNQKETRKS